MGCNLPSHVHMEHLKRCLKTIIRGMRGNISPQTFVKAGKSIRVTQQVRLAFEGMTVQTESTSDTHSYPSVKRDLSEVVKLLQQENVFTPVGNREHSCFKKMKCGTLHKHPKNYLIKKS